MKTSSPGGGEIFFEVMGQGPDLVLLHPFPVNHNFWKPVATALSDKFRIILPDLRGHGESPGSEASISMAQHAADLTAVCKAAGVGRAIFGGVSIGGYVLFEFWRQHPERVAALVLSDTKASQDTPDSRAQRLKAADDVLQRGPAEFFDSMIAKVLGESTRQRRPDVVAAVRGMMSTNRAAGIAGVQRGMAERPDSLATLKTIAAPALVLFGSEDTVTPIAEALLMNRQMPVSQLLVIPGGGHYAAYEQPETAAAMMRQFLAGLRL